VKKLSVCVVAWGMALLAGCASSASGARSKPSRDEPILNEKDIAQMARMGAPTVYNGEATGGAGFTVTTGDGQVWAPEVAPGNTVTRTPSDTSRAIEREDTQSEVIDEGKTETAPQQ
jgi:hypothetical protein